MHGDGVIREDDGHVWIEDAAESQSERRVGRSVAECELVRFK